MTTVLHGHIKRAKPIHRRAIGQAANIGALIIRTRLGGTLYYKLNKEPPEIALVKFGPLYYSDR